MRSCVLAVAERLTLTGMRQQPNVRVSLNQVQFGVGACQRLQRWRRTGTVAAKAGHAIYPSVRSVTSPRFAHLAQPNSRVHEDLKYCCGNSEGISCQSWPLLTQVGETFGFGRCRAACETTVPVKSWQAARLNPS